MHFQRLELALGERAEQADHRAGEHFREVTVDRRRFTQRQHRALALHLQLRLQGVGQQAYVAQGMAQAGAEGIAGKEQVFQEQAVERRQVLGQVQADMLFAALVGGGLPEQVLCGMGETAGRQATRRQPDTDQDPVRIAAAGAQGVDHRAHQRYIVGQITHGVFSSYPWGGPILGSFAIPSQGEAIEITHPA